MCWFLFYPLYNILLVCFRSLLFFFPMGDRKQVDVDGRRGMIEILFSIKKNSKQGSQKETG